MNWANIIGEVQSIDERFRSHGSITWYRGHRDTTWELKSTLHRYIERFAGEFKTRTFDKQKLLREEYKAIYRRFERDSWSLLQGRERSGWGVLFAMQHFGLPTRLLDWTESFACALFFAHQQRKPGDAAAVWVLDPQRLNEHATSRYDLISIESDPTVRPNVDPCAWHPKWQPPADALPTIAVVPYFTNPRMVAQRSAFTLSGDSFEPLDRENGGRLAREGALVKIELPADTFEDAEQYLSTAGVTAFNYYPDLEGLALTHAARTERTIRYAKRLYSDE